MDLFEIRKQLSMGKSLFELPLRVTFYARVSTEKEEQAHSLQNQTGYYEKLIADTAAWEYREGYVDWGITGTSAEKRPSFQEMMEDARAGRFDFILTKEISRFSRNTLDSIRYTQELLQCGVGVFFQSDNINTLLPDSELRLTILSSIAQDEVRKISERVRFGFQRAVEKGTVLGNSRIWGYRKEAGSLVIVPEEARIVQTIFTLYAQGNYGMRALCQELNRRGLRNQNGGEFTFSTVRNIIKNPKYKGYYCGGKTQKVDYKLSLRRQIPPEEWKQYPDQEHVPAIVEEALWDKANALLLQRSGDKKRGEGARNRYPLSGKIFCRTHGVPYYRTSYGGREAWQCREYAAKGKAGCSSPTLYTEEAEELLRWGIRQIFPDPNEIAEQLIRLYQKAAEAPIRRQRNEDRAASLKKQMERLLRLHLQGILEEDVFSAEYQRLQSEVESLTVQEPDQTLPEGLAGHILKQMDWKGGISLAAAEALCHKMEVGEKEEQGIPVQVDFSVLGKVDFTIQRWRGKASVCSLSYI